MSRTELTCDNHMWKLVLLMFFMPILQSSCTPKASNEKTAAPRTVSIEDAKKGEKVDVPTNITGSYLACIPIEQPSADKTVAEYGCRLSERDTNAKIEIDPDRVIWSSNIERDLAIFPQPAQSPYHVVYRFVAASPEALIERTESAESIVGWRKPDGLIIEVKREKIVNVLRPDVFIEEMQVPIVREQSIQPD